MTCECIEVIFSAPFCSCLTFLRVFAMYWALSFIPSSGLDTAWRYMPNKQTNKLFSARGYTCSTIALQKNSVSRPGCGLLRMSHMNQCTILCAATSASSAAAGSARTGASFIKHLQIAELQLSGTFMKERLAE